MSRILVAGLILCSLFTACTKNELHKEEAKIVNLSIWGNYLSPEMQAKFENESGIKIHISNYSSNEELLAKVQMGSSGIDVAVPSDYMVDIMTKMQLLEPLNAEKIPNKNLVSPTFLKQAYDPENKYSLPYCWTTTGIAVNHDLYKGPAKSWKDVLTNPELKGKIALLDDVRETTGAALKMNGNSINSSNQDELNKAKEVLLAAKKNIKMFTSDTVDILKNKEVAVAQAYSSDALQAATKDPSGKIEFLIPEEGSTMAIDNLVLVKGSQHPEAAHKLINFLLSQEVDLAKVKSILSGPVLKDTKSLLPKDLQNNKALFPDEATTKKLEHLHDMGEASKLYEQIWTEVKTK